MMGWAIVFLLCLAVFLVLADDPRSDQHTED